MLFYTYPLKFLFTELLAPTRGVVAIKNYDQLSELFSIYALGYVAVFTVFTVMYLRAYKMRDALDLTELECWDTKHNLREMLLNVGLGMCSFLLANIMEGPWISSAGILFAFTGPLFWLHGRWSEKKRKVIFARLYASPESTTADSLPIELP